MSERLSDRPAEVKASTGRSPNLKVVARLMREPEAWGGRVHFVRETNLANVDPAMESMAREIRQDHPAITPADIIGERPAPPSIES